jgi:glycosyl transferase family 87
MRILRAVLLVVLAAIATVQVEGLAQSLSPPAAYSKDFSQEYLLARALWDGADTNLPIRDLADRYALAIGFLNKDNPTPHPPTAGLFALPFALTTYLWADAAWLIVELACLVASVALLDRGAGLRLRPPLLALMSFLLVGWPPVALELGLGQVTLPILVLLAAAQLALLTGRSTRAGLLLGASLLLKPLAWPWLLVLAHRRDWSALATTAVTVLIGYAVVTLREGPARLGDYFFHVLPEWNAGFLHEPTNASLEAVGQRAFPDQPLAAQLVSLALIAGVLLLVWRSAGPNRPITLALGMATAASIMVSPVGWAYYLVLALLPVANAVTLLRKRPHLPTALALTAVMVLPYFNGILATATLTTYFVVTLSASVCTLLLALATERGYAQSGDQLLVAGHADRGLAGDNI